MGWFSSDWDVSYWMASDWFAGSFPSLVDTWPPGVSAMAARARNGKPPKSRNLRATPFVHTYPGDVQGVDRNVRILIDRFSKEGK